MVLELISYSTLRMFILFINNKRCVSASARDELTAEDIPPFRVRRKE